MNEAMRWFDHHLKGNEAAGDANDPPVEVSDQEGTWRAEAQWPPADAAARTMPLRPGTYTDDANNNAASSPNGVGAWTFTQPVTSDVRIAGVPKLTVDVSTQAPRAALVGLLYDVDAAGKAKLISRGAYAIKQSGQVTFELYPQDWLLKTGHRLGFLVAGDDGDWYLTAHSKQPVTVSGGSVSIPFLATPRTAFIVKNAKTPAMAAQLAITITKATIDANTVPADLP